MKDIYLHEVFGYILLMKTKILIKKLKDSEGKNQVYGRIVRIKGLYGVTTAQKHMQLRVEFYKCSLTHLTTTTSFSRYRAVNPTLMGNAVVDSKNSWTLETSNTLFAETENWQDLLTMYTGLLQEKTHEPNRILEDINETPPPIVRNNRFQSLATHIYS
nr:DNA glycosylase [Tanacetum cinerariifolium]